MRNSLRNELLDAMLDGSFGSGIVITRQDVIARFTSFSENYTKVFLSNSEMTTAAHSPTYTKFTQRISDGVYRVHPEALVARLQELEQ
jgi:hypothetical protein